MYKNLLLTPGGKARVIQFASEYDAHANIDFTAIHQRKTALYASMLEEQGQTIRSGVVRLVKAARAEGIKVGWVTSTEYANLEAVMSRSEGKLSPADFDVVIHRDEALQEKPDPSPYFSALAQLGLDAEQVVAIEDTSGLHAISLAGRYRLHRDAAPVQSGSGLLRGGLGGQCSR